MCVPGCALCSVLKLLAAENSHRQALMGRQGRGRRGKERQGKRGSRGEAGEVGERQGR